MFKSTFSPGGISIYVKCPIYLYYLFTGLNLNFGSSSSSVGNRPFLSRLYWRMKTTVPSASNSTPADLKGAAGSGLTVTQTEEYPVSLSPALKGEIQQIINTYAANKITLTSTEFAQFLKREQQVMPRICN